MSVKLPDDALLSSISLLSKSLDAEERIKTIASMVKSVKEAQDQFTPVDEGPCLETRLCPDACYVLKRLLKGSASLKENVRESFFLALSSVVSVIKGSLPLCLLMQTASKILSVEDLYGSSNASRGEDAAVNSAKLNVYSIVLQEYSPDEISSLDESVRSVMVKEIFDISQSRSFFGHPASKLLLHLYNSDPFCRDLILQRCETCELTLDLVWLLAAIGPTARSHYPASLTAYADVLEAEDLVMRLLDESISFTSGPHDLWFKLLEKKMLDTDFSSFWNSAIDERLFGSESVQRKLVALGLAKWLLAHSTAFPSPSTNLLSLIDRIGAHSLKKKQKGNPLNQSVLHLLSLVQDMPSDHPFVRELSSLKNFRLFPRDTVQFILSDPSSLERYVERITTRLHAEESALDAIESLNDLITRKSLTPGQAIQAAQLAVDSYGRVSEELRAKMLPRLQSLIGACLKVYGFETFSLYSLACAAHLWEAVDDEIVIESKESIEKALKKHHKRQADLSGDHRVVSQVLSGILSFCYLWLLLDPMVVVESIEDLVELLGEVDKGRKSLEKLGAIPIIVDFLLKLLATTSSCLKIIGDHFFKLLVPYCGQETLSLILDVVKSETSSLELEDDEEEGGSDSEEVEFECEESDDEDDETEVTLGKRQRSGSHVESDGEESSAESVVLLDDADAAELEMYDKKLSEIFAHKKSAKMQNKLNKQASIHFKARLVQWVRFCLDASEGLRNVSLKLQFLQDLLSAMSAGLANSESLGVAQSLLDVLKSTLRGSIQPVAPASELPGIFKSIEARLMEECADNQLLWTATFVVLGYILKLMPQEERPSLLQDHLGTCWNSVLSKKKLQKNKFAQYFALWTDLYAPVCVDFIVARNFVAETARVNSHCRSLCFEFIQSSVKKSNEKPQFIRLFEQIIASCTGNETVQSNQLNEASTLLMAIRKKLGSTSSIDLATKAAPFLVLLDSSRRKNVEAVLKI